MTKSIYVDWNKRVIVTTAEDKAELPLRYEKYLSNSRDTYRRKAEAEFKNWFEEIGIEVSGYAE